MQTPSSDPSELRFFYEPDGMLRLTVGQVRSHPTVKLAYAAPLSVPGRFLSVLDAKGEEILMVDDPSLLPAESLDAVRKELTRRYVTCQIESVVQAKVQDGTTYFTVITDRGRRDFVTRSLNESAIWPSDGHVLLTDVDGNRFEIRDIQQLDAESRRRIATIF